MWGSVLLVVLVCLVSLWIYGTGKNKAERDRLKSDIDAIGKATKIKNKSDEEIKKAVDKYE